MQYSGFVKRNRARIVTGAAQGQALFSVRLCAARQSETALEEREEYAQYRGNDNALTN